MILGLTSVARFLAEILDASMLLEVLGQCRQGLGRDGTKRLTVDHMVN